jgi:hypothetical protein
MHAADWWLGRYCVNLVPRQALWYVDQSGSAVCAAAAPAEPLLP